MYAHYIVTDLVGHNSPALLVIIHDKSLRQCWKRWYFQLFI